MRTCRRTFYWSANFAQSIREDHPTAGVADQVRLEGLFNSTHKEFVIAKAGSGDAITIQLTQDPVSQQAPILNAGEVFYVEPVADSTDHRDGKVVAHVSEVCVTCANDCLLWMSNPVKTFYMYIGVACAEEVLQELSHVLRLSHWVGDPCLPVPWDELSSPVCTSNVGEPIRVQSL